MAKMKLKMKKLPKAPKKTASNEAKEAYLKKVADIKAENRKRAAENAKADALDKKIAQARANFKK